MISLECRECGFFFSVELGDDLTDEEKEQAKTCPCGCKMVETEFSLDKIPAIKQM